MKRGRWEDKCVQHMDDASVNDFLNVHFGEEDRSCLLIAGAGFDPRSTIVADRLSQRLGRRLSIIVVRERRPDPDVSLVEMGDITVQKFEFICDDVKFFEIEIFASDNTVVGGRKVLAEISRLNFSDVNDVVLDTSAMSIGISFPIAKYFFDLAKQASSQFNFHFMLASNPELDSGAIESAPNDTITYARGFELGGLMSEDDVPKFWLPLVSERKLPILQMIHRGLSPHDVCPILPFPAEQNPTITDRSASILWAGITNQLTGNDWGLDPKNFVYAGERNPLDIYRTILRIQRERESVFEVLGGSRLVLSPTGSKVPAMGALMAAMECDFSVVYVESLKYTLLGDSLVSSLENDTKLSHIWLVGEAYL